MVTVIMNSNSCLIPDARAIAGLIKWSDEMFAYTFGGRDARLKKDTRDSAAGLPKSVVVSDEFDWADENEPHIPLAESIIYEVHVKGFSKLCPYIPKRFVAAMPPSEAISPSNTLKSSE